MKKIFPHAFLVSVVLSLLCQPVPASPADAARVTVLEVDGDKVEIVRDSFGVPHVYATTLRGLFFGNGYAVAQDRLFQMERYRRDARGSLAELEGKQALNRDRETRRLGYTAGELRQLFDQLGGEERAIFEAYRDGVNAWMREAAGSGRLPEEFAKKNLQPAPWDVIDSIAISVMMAYRFGSGGAGELRNLHLLEKLKEKFGAEKAQGIFDQLWWRNDPESPTSITAEDMQPPATLTPHLLPATPGSFAQEFKRLDLHALERAEKRAAMQDILEYAELNQLPTRWGSYALIISPQKSISGQALLVGGPQMGFTTPQIAHEVHLKGAGFDTIGMGFAGLPLVLIGHNADLAWTTTSGVTDLVDVFAEKLDPQNKYRYWYQSQYRDMERRTEKILVRDGEPEELQVARTVHGPVIEWDKKAGIAYALSASFRGQEMQTMKAMLGFNRARTVEEFARYASLIWLTHNFFAADRNGAIGFWHCGKPPLRAAGIDPRLPTPGTGEHEWRGVMRFEDAPQVINPSRGYVVNWNNKPAPWWDNSDSPVWGKIFRLRRVDFLVKARPKIGVEDLREILIEIGTNDSNAEYLKPYIVAAVERTHAQDPDLRLAAEFLRAWDGHAHDESVGKTIFDAWITSARPLIFRELNEIIDRRTLEQLLQPSAMLHQLEGSASKLPVQYNFLGDRSPDQVIVQALADAVKTLKQKNPQMSAWGYSGRTIDFRPLPPIPSTNRGTYIQIVELSPVIRGISILPPGQSEDPKSPHFGDQRELAGYWKFKPMLTDRAEIEKPEKPEGPR